MQIQKSFQPHSTGTLYLVPTPIGNLEDMTFRGIRTLKEADMIAAEDTRQTRKLCNYFSIVTPLQSYHDHNKEVSGEKFLAMLRAGKNVALVSDAGTPCISDPGYELVTSALAEDIPVVPLPGASAALTALIASGLAPQPFYYYGFLKRKKKERTIELEKLKHLRDTMIFYEAPHRLGETLEAMYQVFGNRQMVASRELTKKFEEFVRGTVEEVIAWTKEAPVRGEFCLVVAGSQEELVEENWWNAISVIDHVNHYIEKGNPSKEAIKMVAKERGIQKRVVYQAYHQLNEE